MSDWVYDVATQSIAGALSSAVVGAALLYSQHRMERRLERERRVLDSQRELLGAAIQMYQFVSRTFGGTANAERVAAGWEQTLRAGADWMAVEAVREFPESVLTVSRKAREELNLDLLAIMAMSPVGGGQSPDERERWLAIAKRRPFEHLEPLIEACKRAPS